MLSKTSLPKTLRELIKALTALPSQTKVEVFEGETLKDIPQRYLLNKKATVIILS